MRQSCYAENQIIRILKEVESGRAVKEVCHEYGVAVTFPQKTVPLVKLVNGLNQDEGDPK